MPRATAELNGAKWSAASEGRTTHRSGDLLGRLWEYLLIRLANSGGKNWGQFYTVSCVVHCRVEMLAPLKGRIYAPTCGSGGICIYGRDRWVPQNFPFGLEDQDLETA